MTMEWDSNNNNNNNNNNHEPENYHQNQNQNQGKNGNIIVSGNENGNRGGMLYVKVMTDEQLETLRKQIAVYAAICEQLVEMHKTLSAHQDLAGARLGNIYCDPLMAAGHKITARQRWTPTPVQLQTLERIFDQGNGTPSKQKIKELTSELSQHGQISETNVYNWFQNRRARSKRKQIVASSNNATESEIEMEVDSSNEKKTKPEILYPQQNPPRAEDLCFQSLGISPELHFFGEDGLTGKIGIPGSYDLYEQSEDYGMAG